MELYLFLIALVAVQIRTRTPSRGVVPTAFVTRVSDLLKFRRAEVSCFCHCCGLRAAWQFQTFRNWVKSVARGMQTGISTATSTTAADRWSADTRTALNGGACQLDTAASLFSLSRRSWWETPDKAFACSDCDYVETLRGYLQPVISKMV